MICVPDVRAAQEAGTVWVPSQVGHLCTLQTCPATVAPRLKEATDEVVCQVVLHGRPSRTHCQMFVLVRVEKKHSVYTSQDGEWADPAHQGNSKHCVPEGIEGERKKLSLNG